MTTWRRAAAAALVVWVLVATNPSSRSAHSFLRYAADVRAAHHAAALPDPAPVCDPVAQPCLALPPRRAFPQLGAQLYAIFAPHRAAPPAGRFRAVDFALFTLVRPDDPAAPVAAYVGVLGAWLPLPSAPGAVRARLASLSSPSLPRDVARRAALSSPARPRAVARRVERGARSAAASLAGARIDADARPGGGGPWQKWLTALFLLVAATWLLFPARANAHLPLTWHGVRARGRWWTLLLFHFSHGGSTLRLARTLAVVHFVAPALVARGAVPRSALHGVMLTSSATSTALGVLVLARRGALRAARRRRAWARAAGAAGAVAAESVVAGDGPDGAGDGEADGAAGTPPPEINGGGACVYALLVAACLSPKSCEPFPLLSGVRPFELLMLNVLFDSFFLAGKKRVADYVAHTGAALGSWLYYAANLAR